MGFFEKSTTWKLLERVAGIEPAYSAWKAAALPLSYTRIVALRRDREPCHAGSVPLAVLTGNVRARFGGGGWIRTSVGLANGFTVRLL